MSSKTSASRVRSYSVLGTLLLFGGLGLTILCAFESADGLAGMPRFWYSNRTMWWALAVGSTAAGFWLLLPQTALPSASWKPSRPGIRFRHVLVYTRNGCHLCDEALELLATYQRWLPQVTAMDIDHDRSLIDKYGTCVPVVVCDGKIRFRGQVAPALLQRLIEGTPPL